MTPAPPPLWVTLCQAWGLSPRQQWGVWQALYRARWTVAVSFRQTLVHFEGFLLTSVTPRTVMDVLEALAAEGQLTRREARTVEEQVLKYVGPTGGWCTRDV